MTGISTPVNSRMGTHSGRRAARLRARQPAEHPAADSSPPQPDRSPCNRSRGRSPPCNRSRGRSPPCYRSRGRSPPCHRSRSPPRNRSCTPPCRISDRSLAAPLPVVRGPGGAYGAKLDYYIMSEAVEQQQQRAPLPLPEPGPLRCVSLAAPRPSGHGQMELPVVPWPGGAYSTDLDYYVVSVAEPTKQQLCSTPHAQPRSMQPACRAPPLSQVGAAVVRELRRDADADLVCNQSGTSNPHKKVHGNQIVRTEWWTSIKRGFGKVS